MSQTTKSLFCIILGSPTEETLAIIRQNLKQEDRKPEGIDFDSSHPHVFVTLGASVNNVLIKKEKCQIKTSKYLPDQKKRESCFTTPF